MSNEKSAAQLKNEAEVQRILKERGYSSSAPSHKQHKHFSITPFILMAIIAGLAYGGWHIYEQISQQEQSTIAKNETEDEAGGQTIGSEYSSYLTCLRNADQSEIAIDDPQFWEKYISQYEQQLACHNDYPTASDPTLKQTLEENLAQAKENLSQANVNDAKYRQAMAELDRQAQERQAKYEQEKRELDAATAQKLQEYDKQRAERDAQYEAQRVEQERQTAASEAQRQANEQAAKAKCDEYKTLYGDKTAQELAEADPEVTGAKASWQQAQKKVRSCTNGNVVSTQAQRERCNAYRDQELATANAYYSTYLNTLSQKVGYYTSLRINSCGYN